jgi:N-acyl homoserine lactone hydrolase
MSLIFSYNCREMAGPKTKCCFCIQTKQAMSIYLKKGNKFKHGKYFLMILLAFFSACRTIKPPRTSFPVPQSTSERNWSAIFAKPKNITVTTIETGLIKVKISDVLNLKNPKAKGFKDSSLYVPVFVHLIQHPVFGDWIIDAGLDSSFHSDPHGNIKGMFRKVFSCIQEKGQDISSQLALRNIAIKGVFFTHLHPDHITGVPALPGNIRYICGKGETQTNIRPLGITLFSSMQLNKVGKMEEFDFSNVPPMSPLGPAIDVFGDGSFWAISTPGHTICHVSFIVNTLSGPVLLTGDVSHTKLGFDSGIEPGGFSLNCPLNLKSLMQLKTFAGEFPQVKLIYGHER